MTFSLPLNESTVAFLATKSVYRSFSKRVYGELFLPVKESTGAFFCHYFGLQKSYGLFLPLNESTGAFSATKQVYGSLSARYSSFSLNESTGSFFCHSMSLRALFSAINLVYGSLRHLFRVSIRLRDPLPLPSLLPVVPHKPVAEVSKIRNL